MKIFNTIQELWNYYSICPVCQENRDITVEVGPDEVFTLAFYKKSKSGLNLDCVFQNNDLYWIQYRIDCLNNTFNFSIKQTELGLFQKEISGSEDIRKGASQAHFYFYIQSSCKKCKCATSYGADMELDFFTKKIDNIKLKRESFFLMKEKEHFHIWIFHDENYITISRTNGFEDIDFEDRKGQLRLPPFELDFSDQAKLVNKIKTFILFS